MSTNEDTPEIIDLTTLTDTPVLATRKPQMSVKLTDEEVSEFGEAMASGALAIDEVEGIEKARASKWRAEHKVREATQLRIVKIYAAKAEDREVEVKLFALTESNERLTVRMDTLEVIDRRALTGPELDKLSQQPLFDPAKPGDVKPGEVSDRAAYERAIKDGTIEELPPAVEPVTIKRVTFADPMAALVFVNGAERLSMEVVGLKGRGLKYILENRPFASLQDLGDVRGIGTKALEAIQGAAKLPPEAEAPKPAESL